jgi:hypothetical protein
LTHAIECAPTETPTDLLYIRTDLEAKGKDLRFTDLGFTTVATEGMQSDSEIGGLWVTYDITFLKPIINADITLDVGVDQFIFQSNTDEMYAGIVTIRNNVLAGNLGTDGSGLVYTFNQGISNGTYVVIEEYQPVGGIVSKLDDSARYAFENAALVIDSDNNGPWNSQYSTPPISAAIADTIFIPSSSTTAAIRVAMVKITGPRPSFKTQKIVFSGQTCFTRITIMPVSYSDDPLAPGPTPVIPDELLLSLEGGMEGEIKSNLLDSKIN